MKAVQLERKEGPWGGRVQKLAPLGRVLKFGLQMHFCILEQIHVHVHVK